MKQTQKFFTGWPVKAGQAALGATTLGCGKNSLNNFIEEIMKLINRLLRFLIALFILHSVTFSQKTITTATLQQNYSNPFNPNTTINYSLPEDGDVSLKVYNILGREVAVLVNEWQSIGLHSVTFSMYSFSSGLYILNLRTGRFNISRKMLLIK